MTVEATRRILWITLLLTVPVPYWVMEGGWVPTFWLLDLSGFSLAVLLTEGGSIVGLLTGLFVLEAVIAALALHVVARIGARLLDRALPRKWHAGSVAAAVLVLLGASLLRVYTTPLVAGGTRVNLLRLFT